MDAITYTHARANLAGTMEDFQALEETAYLLRSPANAKRLFKSIEQLEAGRGQARELAE